jgi:methionyl-tRNA formyltransferase
LSLVFLGTSDFAAAILERLARSDDQRPALVLTRPDSPSGRGRRLRPPPVAERARALGLALAQPERVNDPEARALIAAAGDDEGHVAATGSGPARSESDDRKLGGEEGASKQTVIVCAFGALIKEPLLSEHELINVHPSLLPRWRGAAPIERALMAGDARSGVSIMKLTAGLDDGPVCLTGEERIAPDDDYASLSARLQELAGELLLRALRERPPFRPQARDGTTYAEKIAPADRLLDPARVAAELERVVRALHPHIGARAALADGSLLGVERSRLLDPDSQAADAELVAWAASLPPGLMAHDGRLALVCAGGALELLVVKPPGGRAMDAAAYLRGHPQPGRL